MEVSTFSVNGTLVESIPESGGIAKRLTPRLPTRFSLDALLEMILAYRTLLYRHGVPVPAVLDASSQGGSIFLVLADVGVNLQQAFPSALDLLADEDTFSQVAIILKSAQSAGVALDPHPKNFTLDHSGLVWHVDWTPPLLPEFISDALRSVGPDAAALLEANYAVFGPELLGYHFLADFFAIGRPYYLHRETIGRRFADLGLVANDMRLLRQITRCIRRIEDERVRQGIPLF